MALKTPTKCWYAMYTRPRWEKKIATQLEKKDVEVYCPLHRVLRQWSDRKKMVYEPLFRSYVFVKVYETDLWRIRQEDGVINVVNWQGKPAVIKEKEIEIIKRFINNHTAIEIEKTEIKVNDTVRIMCGPLMQNEGSILMVKNNRVKVLLPSLGYIMTAEVKKEDVELININGHML